MKAPRIHPSTGLMLERYVPAGGAVLHGKFIPGGTTIGVNAWVFNRDKDILVRTVMSYGQRDGLTATPSA